MMIAFARMDIEDNKDHVDQNSKITGRPERLFLSLSYGWGRSADDQCRALRPRASDFGASIAIFVDAKSDMHSAFPMPFAMARIGAVMASSCSLAKRKNFILNSLTT